MKRHVATLLITIGFVTIAAHSQAPVGLEGKWEGTLVAGPNQLRVVLNITRASDGLHLGTMSPIFAPPSDHWKKFDGHRFNYSSLRREGTCPGTSFARI